MVRVGIDGAADCVFEVDGTTVQGDGGSKLEDPDTAVGLGSADVTSDVTDGRCA